MRGLISNSKVYGQTVCLDGRPWPDWGPWPDWPPWIRHCIKYTKHSVSMWRPLGLFTAVLFPYIHTYIHTGVIKAESENAQTQAGIVAKSHIRIHLSAMSLFYFLHVGYFL